MPTAYSNPEFDYVLMRERNLPQEQRTVFRMRRLSWRAMQEIYRKIKVVDNEVDVDPMDMARKVLDLGLVDWRNFLRDDGSEFPLTRDENGGLSEEVLDVIAGDWSELSNAITDHSKLPEGVAKNSGSP